MGLIPAGKHRQSIPLKNVSDVGLNTSYKASRFLIGIILIISGFSLMSNDFLLGLIAAVFGVIECLNGIETTLRIEKGGSGYLINVPFFDKSTMINVQEVIEEALNTDADKGDMSLYHHRIKAEELDEVE